MPVPDTVDVPDVSHDVGYVHTFLLKSMTIRNIITVLTQEYDIAKFCERKCFMENFWKNAIMGVVIGDALGYPVQYNNREIISQHPVTDMIGYGTLNLPAGTWTDASSLTLALLDSIRMTDKLDLNHIMNNFVSWMYDGDFTPFGHAFDIDRGTMQAIKAYKHHRNPHQYGSYDERNNGNGSLMRIMPACIYCYEQGLSDQDAIREIHAVGSLTHAHIRSNIACGLYYFMVKSIISGKAFALKDRLQEGLNRGFAYYEKALSDHENLEYYNCLRDLSKFAKTRGKDIRSSGYVVDTLEAAVWSLLVTDSFESALLKAVNLGDDSATVGAVTGGLAGLGYSLSNLFGVKSKWIDAIQRKDWIEQLCDEVNDHLEQRVKDSHPCIAFSVEDAEEAYKHIEKERVKDYGARCGNSILHTWDDGQRLLMRCKKCGGFFLLQVSEFHGVEEDRYYQDLFPVAGPNEALTINKTYDGETIELEFPYRWMIADRKPHWNK